MFRKKDPITVIFLGCVDGRGGNGINLGAIKGAFGKEVTQYFQVTAIGGVAGLDQQMTPKEEVEGTISKIIRLAKLKTDRKIIWPYQHIIWDARGLTQEV